MPRLSRIHFISELADRFHTSAVLFEFAGETLFNFGGSARLILDSSFEPGGIDTETVHPIARGDQCFNQSFETEVAEQFLDSGVAAVNFIPDRLAGAFAREVDAPLFIEDCE